MRTALPVLLSLCLVASPAFCEPRPQGEYPGFIWSGGRDSAARTAFTTASDGMIVGTYAFEEEAGLEVQGLIDDCALAALVLRCRWTDDYGSGALVVRFTTDFWAFEGSWFPAGAAETAPDPDSGYRWTGAKVGT